MSHSLFAKIPLTKEVIAILNTTKSTKWKMWSSINDFRRCLTCEGNHGKIYEKYETPNPKPPAHFNCRCTIEALKALLAGTATNNGSNGADWYLKYFSKLPDYYISINDAMVVGWKRKKTLNYFCPGKMMFGGTYKNKNKHLPESPGRIWYEADINYTSGKRNTSRIVFSNDGLIFVTYDHYHTFYEII
ncbi:MAG: phage head morphogenesis protein [Clostridia bacterium]|nr:phage head morphogenesis protein [Clostridia bacterium]